MQIDFIFYIRLAYNVVGVFSNRTASIANRAAAEQLQILCVSHHIDAPFWAVTHIAALPQSTAVATHFHLQLSAVLEI